MGNIRLKDKADIGRDLNDNDLIFTTKTNEDTDNPSSFFRIKNQITAFVTGLTETFYSKIGHIHSIVDINNLSNSLDTKANLSGTTFSAQINTPIISATTISAETIYSATTNLYNIFNQIGHTHLVTDVNNLSNSLDTKVNLSGATFSAQINTPIMSATTISADTINGEISLTTCYLYYDGSTGTTSGTYGCTLTSPGNWSITKFNTIYTIDDRLGNITITIPDASINNIGKYIYITKAKATQTQNHITILTPSGQNVSKNSTFKIWAPDSRVQLVSYQYDTNGKSAYRYRIASQHMPINEVVEVSYHGTALFSSITEALNYVNSSAVQPMTVKINPGYYYIDNTIQINCPYPISIDGFGTEMTNLIATNSLSGKPMFDIKTACDFSKIKFSGTSGYGLIDDECCLDCSTNGLYFEAHNIIIEGFFKGIEVECDSEFWVFDSIIRNCVKGVSCIGGSMGISEMSLFNNTNSLYLSASTTGNSFSVQNTIFNIETNQIGINYKDDKIKPKYHFVTSNAFYGNGIYTSGLTFTSKTQSDIRYENNAGLQNYRPESWMWISGNTNTTTIASSGTYSAASINVNSIQNYDFIKFSGTGTEAKFTYLPNIPRKCIFNISGDISVAGTNQVLSVALFKNNSILQNIDIRCATSAQPYPFSFSAINKLIENDSFEIRVSNLAATNNITLRTLMFSITTI